jgi:rRNA maturation protein Nop10
MCTNDLQKLRKCPFCGGEADMNDEGSECSPDRFWAYCTNPSCFVEGTGVYATEEEAAQAWNTRVERTCQMKEARWDDGQCTWGVICSACGEKHEHSFEYSFNFCPTCGAKVVKA